MPYRMKGVAVLVAVCALTILSATPALAWSSENWTVPWPNADAGSITLDKYGAKHIVYGLDCKIYYRTNKSGSWVVTRVLGVSDASQCYNLSDTFVTREGKVYFTYRRETSNEVRVKFATNASGSWLSRDAVAPGDAIYMSDPAKIAVQGGVPRVVYSIFDRFGSRPPKLMLRTYRTDGTIGVTTLATGCEVCAIVDPDIGVDAAGKAHVAAEFGDGERSLIKYFTNRSGAWSSRTVSAPEGFDGSPSLAVDSEGFVHVAWQRCVICDDFHDKSIVYANNRSGSWVRTTLFSGNPSGPLLAYSSGAHILWSEFGPLNEDVIHYVNNVGGTWQSKLITFPKPLDDESKWQFANALGIAARLGHPYILFVSTTELADPAVAVMGIKSN